VVYGDLNGGSRRGDLDSGTDAQATAPGLVGEMRLEPDKGSCGLHERSILSDMTTGGRVSWLR